MYVYQHIIHTVQASSFGLYETGIVEWEIFGLGIFRKTAMRVTVEKIGALMMTDDYQILIIFKNSDVIVGKNVAKEISRSHSSSNIAQTYII